MANEVRARDVSAPVKYITLDGTRYKLAFNNLTARLAEEVYELHYGRDMGYADIIRQLALGKYAAVMAVYYGALVAGGHDMSWEDFDATFKLDSVDGIREIIADAIAKALPDPDADKANP